MPVRLFLLFNLFPFRITNAQFSSKISSQQACETELSKKKHLIITFVSCNFRLSSWARNAGQSLQVTETP